MQTDQELIEAWLSEQRTANTKHIYTIGIAYFQKWWKKPLAEFLALPPEDMRHIALQYQGYLKDELKRKTNTVVSFMTALQSLCAQKCKPLLLRRKRLGIAIDTHSHIFSNGDLSKMFDVANIEQRAVLSTKVSLGWEVSSILELRKDFIAALLKRAQEEGERFVYFRSQRPKTNALRLGVLNPLAIDSLSKWFEDPRCKGPGLFSYTSKEGINSLLRHLARDAHLTLRGSVHSHQIRKWVMSGLSRARFNSFQIKFLMGKQIPASDATYLQTLEEEIREFYPEAYEHYLNLRPEKIVKVVDEALTMKVATLERENQELKNRVDRDLQTEKLEQYREMIHAQAVQIAEQGKFVDEQKKAIELHGKQLLELKKLVEGQKVK